MGLFSILLLVEIPSENQIVVSKSSETSDGFPTDCMFYIEIININVKIDTDTAQITYTNVKQDIT